MKVIAINGSPRKGGNTRQALEMMATTLKAEAVDCEIIDIGNDIKGCKACNGCAKTGQCVIKDDIVNVTGDKLAAADGFILASPTYYAGVAGSMKSFCDRMFYSHSAKFRHKVATVCAVVRRTGGIEVFHELNHYLNLSQVIIPPSRYWLVAHGRAPGEVMQDIEGIQALRENAKAMAWLIKTLKESKVTPPEQEIKEWMHFIR